MWKPSQLTLNIKHTYSLATGADLKLPGNSSFASVVNGCGFRLKKVISNSDCGSGMSNFLSWWYSPVSGERKSAEQTLWMCCKPYGKQLLLADQKTTIHAARQQSRSPGMPADVLMPAPQSTTILRARPCLICSATPFRSSDGSTCCWTASSYSCQRATSSISSYGTHVNTEGRVHQTNVCILTAG